MKNGSLLVRIILGPIVTRSVSEAAWTVILANASGYLVCDLSHIPWAINRPC